MAKPMTWSESIVGRRLSPYPKHLDTVMNMYWHNGQAFPPIDTYLRPAFRQARKNGWIRRTRFGLSIMGGKAEYMWELTERGKVACSEAHERFVAAHTARELWGKDFNIAYKAFKANNEQEKPVDQV